MKKHLLLAIVIMLSCSFFMNAQDFKTHKVKQGETIETIAKSYLITVSDIYALNPDAKKKLDVDTVLIIPSSKVKNEPLVEDSKEVIDYKTHKTKRKETLYSISKKYNVEIEDIKKHNTFLYANNLRKGDKLKIPRYKTIVSNVSLNNTLKRYTVLPTEGKWRVAYKFGITVPELEALNPEMNAVLQPGDVLNMPNISNKEEKAVEDNYSYYTVLKSEGYMALKRKLNVDKETLETLNPELKDGGLKLGMVLKLPAETVKEAEGVLDVTSVTVANIEPVENVNLTDNLTNLKAKRIALMMPYRLNRIDVSDENAAKRIIKTDSRLSISLDFHVGALMALDSAKQLGISTYLKVFDTRDQIAQVAKILDENDFSEYNAVIGPLMPANLERVASTLKSDDVPVLSPFTMPEHLYENVYQTIPSNDLLEIAMINHVKQDSLPKQIIIISDAKSKAISTRLKAEFPSAKQLFSRKNKEGKDANYLLDSDIINVLKSGRNIVFLETESEAFISNVTSRLNSLMDKNKTIILMTTDKNKAFNGKDISNYHLSNLQLHYPSVNKAFSTTNKNSFVKAYEKEYGVPPSKYAVRGFDLTLDVILRLASEEDLYKASGKDIETEYVENKFRYGKKLFGGYYNESVYVLKYDELAIVEAK